MRGKSAKRPDLEMELKIWIEEQRAIGIPVSTKMVQHEARRIADEKEVTDFKGGHNWCFRLMKQNGLSMRTCTRLAQKMPENYEQKVLEFHCFVIQCWKTHQFELGQIANMDEVPLQFDVPSNRTVVKKGVKTVTVKTSGHEKSYYTVVVACCADGTKLPPMLIFKRKTMPKEYIP